jgi:hypothetical protein
MCNKIDEYFVAGLYELIDNWLIVYMDRQMVQWTVEC